MSQALNLQRIQQALLKTSTALLSFGRVQDQSDGLFKPYDPNLLTKSFQQEVLAYFDNPPTTPSGHTTWLTCLTSRQMGKSLIVEYAAYPKTAYTPGHDHVCIADTGPRADYLHKRVHYLHEYWPLAIRSKTIPNRESRQLTFLPSAGGKMRVLSGESSSVGIGQSPDSFHASECAFWADFAGTMSLILPSLQNRKHATAVFECTPWAAGSDWHEQCITAQQGIGRNRYLFKPFWDSILNVRPVTGPLTNEEITLLNKYGPLGLTQENLFFRREVLQTDVELRRRPENFEVYYPFDDVSCWISNQSSVIPAHALDPHIKNVAYMFDWKGPYMELEPPERDAIYVIGVDPSGHAARDHASFQVIKVFDGWWQQVAVFADHIDPLTFSQALMRAGERYNNAKIIVESNGVGQSVITYLRDHQYPNIYYEALGKPGFTSSPKSLQQAIAYLIDALMDELVLFDKDTVKQLQSYKNDKSIEESAHLEMIRAQPTQRRRERHHWDKISALMFAIIAARRSRQVIASSQRKQPSYSPSALAAQAPLSAAVASIPPGQEGQPIEPTEVIDAGDFSIVSNWEAYLSADNGRARKQNPWYSTGTRRR